MKDFQKELDDYFNQGSNYQFKKKETMHSYRTLAGLAILFIVGGLQAIHNIGGVGSWIDMIVPVLLVIEHGLQGNTN
jgi:hypothetical protein